MKTKDASKTHPYTTADIQKATGMKPSTFQAWKARHTKQLVRGLDTPVTKDPTKPTRKIYSEEYMERVKGLIGDAYVPVKAKTQTKTAKAKTAPVTAPEYMVVKMSTAQKATFTLLADQLGWEIKRDVFLINP